MLKNRKQRWLLTGILVLGFILVPFFLFGEYIEAWTQDFLKTASGKPLLIAAVLGLLLASDILLPIPSSVVSTAAGLFLGFQWGTLTSLAGMTVSCAAGFWMGVRLGRPFTKRILGSGELERLENMNRLYGDWVIVVARPVPVLAEASVLFAGVSRMPITRFMLLATLSNLGISGVYAAVGAMSATVNSFLLAMAGAILIPWLAMVIMGKQP
jgi:uncharacterized membrane protein YdjX (TVP38/TMEM64 family)